jgi:hypothetical protein
MSPQNIPLKGRTDFRDAVEFRPQRLFAFELRRVENAARANARIPAGVLARALVERCDGANCRDFCRSRDDPAAANLELAFNSLDAQREACEAYIRSQARLLTRRPAGFLRRPGRVS